MGKDKLEFIAEQYHPSYGGDLNQVRQRNRREGFIQACEALINKDPAMKEIVDLISSPPQKQVPAEEFLTGQGLWNYADNINLSREKLMELLNKFASLSHPSPTGRTEEWISVEDRLPEIKVKKIGNLHTAGTDESEYLVTDGETVWTESFIYGEGFNPSIIAWRKFPLPPSTETKKGENNEP